MEDLNLYNNLNIDLYHGFNIDNVCDKLYSNLSSTYPTINVTINELAYDIHSPGENYKSNIKKVRAINMCFFLFLLDDLQRLTNSISLPVDKSINLISGLLGTSLVKLAKTYDYVVVLNPFFTLKNINKTEDSKFYFAECYLAHYIMNISKEYPNIFIHSSSPFSALSIDAKLYYYASLPFGIQTSNIVTANILNAVTKVLLPIPKALVIDLDNTIWGGIVGEDGVDGLQIGLTPVGNIFIQIQASIKRIADYVLPIIVISKNNEEDAKEVFNDNRMILALSDFVSFNASWEPKYQTLIKSLSKINLSIAGIYILDDSVIERNEMIRNDCDIQIINKESDCISMLKDLLEFESYLFSTLNSNENRNTSYKAISRAEIDRTSFKSRKEFLDSLNMSLLYEVCNNQTKHRCVDLINRTNQFNLTTERLSMLQFERRILKRNVEYITLKIKDKYTDHGVVGIIGLQFISDVCLIRHLLLSCRMLNRDAELSMLSKVKDCAHANKSATIIGWYKELPKSRLVSTFYEENSFKFFRQRNKKKYYMLESIN